MAEGFWSNTDIATFYYQPCDESFVVYREGGK